jgi:hypothetical protein
MFADGIRLDGLRVLAAHHLAAGLRASADYLRQQNPWASEHRTPEILEVLTSYGAHAQAVLPQLDALATEWSNGEPNFPRQLSRQKAAAVRAAMEKIRASTDRPELKPAD